MLLAIGVIILFLPLILVLFNQINSVKKDFWVPPVDFSTVVSCYINPFARKFWILTPSVVMIVIIYCITLVSAYFVFIKHKEDKKLLLGLALVIFHFTVLTALIISLAFKPILYPRYIMTIAPLLMVPPALYFINSNYKWIKRILLASLFCCGIYIAVSASFFSMGPYRQTLEYIHKTYPDVKKILHINEVTAGPLTAYSIPGQATNYWLKNENTVAYTNVDVFDKLHQVKSIDEMLKDGEIFCLVNFKYLPLNSKNEELILSRCKVVKVDEVIDNKSPEGIVITLHILQYEG